jgi:hypothetical protein
MRINIPLYDIKIKFMEKELNEEYISLISQMRELNKKRVEIYDRFRKLKPDVNEEIKEMRTVSLYHDLYGNDLDKI